MKLVNRLGKEYIPGEGQLKAHQDPRRYILFMGGMGCISGDSVIDINQNGEIKKLSIEKLCSRVGKADITAKKISVLSYDGMKIKKHYINNVLYSGKKEIISFELETGHKIKCTKDHNIMTNLGFVEAEDLTEGSYVMYNKNGLASFSKLKNKSGIIDKVDTFDICCNEPFHNFVANGIVVHNSGKSAWGVTTMVELMSMFPNNFGVIVRDTIKNLKNSTLITFFDWCPPGIIQSFNRSELLCTLVNGSRILFTGSDNPEQFRSMELGAYMLDEVNKIDKRNHDEIKLRLRCPGVPAEYLRGMYVTNPTSKKHWVWQTFERADKKLYGTHLISTYENQAHLPKGYIETIASGMSDEEKKRYIMGMPTFDKLGEPVYSDFSYELHVRKLEYNVYLPVLRGWDFGFRNPAVVFMQIDEDGRVKVLAEFQVENIKLEDFAQKVFEFTKQKFPFARNFMDYCDPAGSQRTDKDKTSVEILNECLSKEYGGIRKVFFDFSNRSIKKGVKIINQLLRTFIGGKPMMQIDESCEMFIEGMMGGYCMDDKKDDEIKKDGVYDHLQDAFRYIIINRSYDLEEVSQDYSILTADDYRPRNLITGY